MTLAGPYCPPKDPTKNLEKISNVLNQSLSDSKTFFDSACRADKKDNVQTKQITTSFINKPRTDSLRTTIPYSDGNGRTTQEFLDKVMSRIRDRHEFNKNLALQIKYCTTSTPTDPDPKCDGINKWLKNQLPQITNLARFNLSLAHYTDDPSLLGPQSERILNANLDEKKSIKVVPWNPLTKEELLISKKAFSEMSRNVYEAISERSPPRISKIERTDLYKSEFLKVRHTHYMIYLSLMGINPILQYIKSDSPGKSEINTAASEVLKNLEKEKAQLDKIGNALKRPYSIGRAGTKTFDSEILSLMDYRTEVEEVLLENPQFCGLGLSLNQVKSNKQLTTAIAGLPLLVISFFVPPVYGLAIGALTSGYFIYDSQNSYTNNLTRENARIQREGMSDFLEKIVPDGEGKSSDQIRNEMQNDVTSIYRSNLQHLKQSESDRDVSVVMAPAMLFSPVAAKYIASYRKGMNAAIKTSQ